MRLIDADSLFMSMDNGIQGMARKYLKFYQMAVNDEPTAYDMDKVMEQLHNAGGCDGSTEYARGWDDAMEEAERIVKAGDANEVI